MELERRLARTLLEGHPQDAAKTLEELPAADAVAILARARPRGSAQILTWSAPHFAAAVLEALEVSEAGGVLEEMSSEVAAGLLRRVDEPIRARLIASLAPKAARPVEKLLRFPPGVAGTLMDPRALGLPQDLTAKEALPRVKEAGDHALFNIPVLDRADVLVGVLTLRDLLRARPGDPLPSLMTSPAPAIAASADRLAVVSHPAWQELHSLPVVDERGVYLGAIRYRTIRRLEHEAVRALNDARSPTVRALGDLFSTAVGGLVGAMASAFETSPPDSPESR